MNLRHDRTVGWNLSCLGLQSIPRDSVTQCLFCRDITGRKRCATSKDYKTSSSPGLLAPMDALTVLPERLFAIRCICRTIGLQFVINSLLLYLKYLGFIKGNINTRVNTWFLNLHVLLITFDSTQPLLKLTQNDPLSVARRPIQWKQRSLQSRVYSLVTTIEIFERDLLRPPRKYMDCKCFSIFIGHLRIMANKNTFNMQCK